MLPTRGAGRGMHGSAESAGENHEFDPYIPSGEVGSSMKGEIDTNAIREDRRRCFPRPVALVLMAQNPKNLSVRGLCCWSLHITALAGEIVRVIEPHTEAGNAAL